MSRLSRFGFAVLMFLLGAGLPSDLWAACILPTASRPVFDVGPVPVYISDDFINATTLGYTRVGDPFVGDLDDEIRWVRAAIDAINSASVDGPRLYYAGLDGLVDWTAPNFWSTRSPGITISTYGQCANEVANAWAVSSVGPMGHTNKCAIRMNRGATYPGGVDACQTQGFDEYWWVDPADDDASTAQNHDFMGVVTHELLHCFGLGHTDNPNNLTCDAGFPITASSASVMYTGNKNHRRRLRRDDIEGLRLLYGEPERNIRESSSDSSPPTGLTWTAPGTINAATLFTNTPAVLANAAANYDEQRLAGFTNASDEVRYFTGTWGAWDANATTGTQIQTGGGAAVYSYDHVAVARGRPWFDTSSGAERRMVAWVGGSSSSCCGAESTTTFDNYIRYRVYADGTWKTHQVAGPTRYKNLGAGYDPRTDQFVLAYIDFHPTVSTLPSDQRLFVRTVHAWTGGGGCTQALTTVDHVLEVGDVACDFINGGAFTQCIIPVATTTDDGPELSFIQGTIEPFAGFDCFVRAPAPDPSLIQTGVYAYGQLSTALNARLAQGVMLGAYVPDFAAGPGASGYSYIYTMTRDAAGLLSGTMANSKTFTTDYWPLHVGSQALASGSQRWRVFTY